MRIVTASMIVAMAILTRMTIIMLIRRSYLDPWVVDGPAALELESSHPRSDPGRRPGR